MINETRIYRMGAWQFATVAGIALFASQTVCAADPREAELKKRADFAYRGITAMCKGTTFMQTHKTIAEVKDFRVLLSVNQVSELDKMNGVEWTGSACVSFGYHRFWDIAGRKWGEWKGGTSHCSQNFQKHYKKVNGRILQEQDNPWAKSMPYYLYPLTCETVDNALQGIPFGYRPPLARKGANNSIPGQVTAYRILSSTYDERSKVAQVTIEVDYSHDSPSMGLPLLGAWVTKNGNVLSVVRGETSLDTKRGKAQIGLRFETEQVGDAFETDSIAFGIFEFSDREDYGPNELAPIAKFKQNFLWRTARSATY